MAKRFVGESGGEITSIRVTEFIHLMPLGIVVEEMKAGSWIIGVPGLVERKEGARPQNTLPNKHTMQAFFIEGIGIGLCMAVAV